MGYFLNFDWPNQGHFLLLSFVEIKVAQDGTALTKDPRGYWLDGDPAGNEIEIEVAFRLTINGTTRDVLHAQAKYQANDAFLTGTSWTQAGAQVPGDHPLLIVTLDKTPPQHTSSPGNQSTAVTQALAAKAWIQTTFVDLTAWWFALHGVNDPADTIKAADEYRKRHPTPDEMLVVLGYTGPGGPGAQGQPVKPLLWFASVPKACRTADVVGRLLFFRPKNYDYANDSVDGITKPEHRFNGMYQLCRFLLTPDPASPDAWLKDTMSPSYVWLCAGFEQALERSGKAVVLLMPWAHEMDAGDAVTNRLPSLAWSAVNVLHAAGRVAVGKGSPAPHLKALTPADIQALTVGGKFNPPVPPLGIMGFSFGGSLFWQAVRENAGLVNEIYSVDANLLKDRQGKAVDPSGFILNNARAVAAKKGQCRARVVWGLNLIKATADGVKALDGKVAGLTVSIHPRSEDFWTIPPTSTGSPWWSHALGTFPIPTLPGDQLTLRRDLRHQFAVFGGEGSPAAAVTFLEQFLGGSSFP